MLESDRQDMLVCSEHEGHKVHKFTSFAISATKNAPFLPKRLIMRFAKLSMLA